jgi:hypothetical protein
MPALDFPMSPADGDVYQPVGGPRYVWQAGTNAWIFTVASGGGDGGGGGGGGGGSMTPAELEELLKITPVAALSSTVKRPMPDWLAGAPVLTIPGDVLLAPNHRGCWLNMMSDIGSTVYLPNNWTPGMGVGVRQIGVGPCLWQAQPGADVQLPFTRGTHTGISEQYEEVIFRVISNVSGAAAVWGVSGGTF